MLERGENLKTNLSSSFRVSTVQASFSKSFYFFHSSCSPLFVFQLRVRTDWGRGTVKQKRTGVDKGREGG